jgi:hypothetical protein
MVSATAFAYASDAISTYAGVFGKTLNHFLEAHYVNGKSKKPSNEDLKIIESDIARIKWMGMKTIGAGAFFLGTAYVIYYDVSYIGPLLSVIPGVIGVAFGVLAHDSFVSAHNFQKAKEHLENFVKMDEPDDDFRFKLFHDVAKKGTIIGALFDRFVVGKVNC